MSLMHTRVQITSMEGGLSDSTMRKAASASVTSLYHIYLYSNLYKHIRITHAQVETRLNDVLVNSTKPYVLELLSMGIRFST